MPYSWISVLWFEQNHSNVFKEFKMTVAIYWYRTATVAKLFSSSCINNSFFEIASVAKSIFWINIAAIVFLFNNYSRYILEIWFLVAADIQNCLSAVILQQGFLTAAITVKFYFVAVSYINKKIMISWVDTESKLCFLSSASETCKPLLHSFLLYNFFP